MPKKAGIKSGTCPQCGSSEVYFYPTALFNVERAYLSIGPLKRIKLESYLCTSCGHFEEYLCDKNLEDKKTIETVKKKWKKVE